MSAGTGVINRPLKRKVEIRRDGADFVISFQPEDLIVFRHAEARALRKACLFLRWEVVSDTVPEVNNLASW
jgi:hypothetical protein